VPGKESGDDTSIEDIATSRAARSCTTDNEDDGGATTEPIVRPREKAARELTSEEADDEFEGDESEQPRTRKRGSDEDRPRRKQRLKKKSKSGQLSATGLMIGAGVVLFVLALGGLGTLWYLKRDINKGTGSEDELAYVPADATVLIGFDIGTLTSQPAIGTPLESLFKRGDTFLAECKKNGIEFRDLFDHSIMVSSFNEEGPSIQTVIVKSRIPFSQKKIRDSAKDAEAQRFQGKTYFKVKEKDFSVLYMPSNRVAVFSNMPEKQMEKLISSGADQPSLTGHALDLARQVRENHLWVVVPFSQSMRESMQQGAVPVNPPALKDALVKARGISVSGRLERDKLKYEVSLACSDQASAQEAESTLRSAWDTQMNGPAVEAALSQMSGGSGVQQAFFKEIMEHTEFSSAGSNARMTGELSARTVGGLLTQIVQANVAMERLRNRLPGRRPPGVSPGP
jgi:hypothetical protein